MSFHCISAFNLRAAVGLPDYGKCNSALPPRDGDRGVTVTKTGSGAIVVSAKSERKNGISVQNTNQLAGNHTFIILLTLISFQGKCPHSPFTGSLSLSSHAFSRFRSIPSLCLTQTNSVSAPCHDNDTFKLPACHNKFLQSCQNWPHRTEIMGVKCEALSYDKC